MVVTKTTLLACSLIVYGATTVAADDDRHEHRREDEVKSIRTATGTDLDSCTKAQAVAFHNLEVKIPSHCRVTNYELVSCDRDGGMYKEYVALIKGWVTCRY